MSRKLKLVSNPTPTTSRAWTWYEDLQRRLAASGRFVLPAETITPNRATRLLETNYQNRNISHVVVQRYQKLMQDGLWTLNGESLKLDDACNLHDGQHRLWASVIGDIDFVTTLDVGLPRDSRETLDQGWRRMPNHIINLSMGGVKNTDVIASATRILLSFDIAATPALTRARSVPAPEILLAYQTKYSGLDAVFSLADLIYRSLKFPSRSVLMALIHMTQKASPDTYLEFWNPIATGLNITSDTDPRHRLRQYYTSTAASRGNRPSEYVTIGTSLKAWNLWRAGRPVRTLSLKDAEAFPKPQ